MRQIVSRSRRGHGEAPTGDESSGTEFRSGKDGSASTVSIESTIATPATKRIPPQKAVKEFLQPAPGRSIDVSCADTVRHAYSVSLMFQILMSMPGKK